MVDELATGSEIKLLERRTLVHDRVKERMLTVHNEIGALVQLFIGFVHGAMTHADLTSMPVALCVLT